jgi:hypothetical protein
MCESPSCQSRSRIGKAKFVYVALLEKGIPAVGVGHQPIEPRPRLRAADADVHVLSGDGPTTTLGVLAKFPRLHVGVLAVVCRAQPLRRLRPS